MLRKLVPVILLALSLPKAVAQGPKKAAKPEKTMEQKILGTQKAIGKSIDRAAEKIDIILAGKKYTRKANPSSIVVRQLSTWSEGGRTRNAIDFGINLRLPNVERRWQLRFASYDEEAEARDLREQRVRTQPRERDYGASLLFFEKLGNVKTTFQPRLELRDPLEMSYILKFETRAESTKFEFQPKLELFADPQKGTGQFGALNFRWELNPKLDFIWQNTEEYREKGNLFLTQHTFALDQSLAKDRAIGFSLNFASNNRPSYHLEAVTLAETYSQEIYKDQLRFRVTPYWTFPKAERFKGTTGISVNFELIF